MTKSEARKSSGKKSGTIGELDKLGKGACADMLEPLHLQLNDIARWLQDNGKRLVRIDYFAASSLFFCEEVQAAAAVYASGSQVDLAHLLDQHAVASEHLHEPGDDRLQQRVQFVVAGRSYLDKAKLQRRLTCTQVRSKLKAGTPSGPHRHTPSSATFDQRLRLLETGGAQLFEPDVARAGRRRRTGLGSGCSLDVAWRVH